MLEGLKSLFAGAIHARRRMHTRHDVVVRDLGNEIVELVIDKTVVLHMHYEDALQISQWIRCHAKRAKERAGDSSRHWSTVGDITPLDIASEFAHKGRK